MQPQLIPPNMAQNSLVLAFGTPLEYFVKRPLNTLSSIVILINYLPQRMRKYFLNKKKNHILNSVCNCILLQGHPLDQPLLFGLSKFAIYFVVAFFFYSLVVLCLVAQVNLAFMSYKTELSLINHLVLSCIIRFKKLNNFGLEIGRNIH